MIQELLGGAGLEGLPCPSPSPSPSPSPTPSPSPSPSSSTTATPTTSSDNQNQNQNQNQLRCPRCDSSNTKFCYYNNYNLTQPRHFCKTCRRYWTKGGALRNVPIGGGCRKNKSAVVTASVSKSSAGRLKLLSPEFGKSGLLTGLEQELPSNPLMWGSPHNSHLLALLRATHNPNPNPNYNPNAISASVGVKEEAGPMIGAHMSTDYGVAGGVLNGTRTALGFDPLGQVPSIGLCSSFWRNNQHQPHHQNSQSQSQSQAHQNGIAHEVVQNTGIQELYQRLRSSSTYNYYPDHSPLVLGNVAPSSSSPSSAILESAPLAGTELGYWAPTLSWSDHLPTTNGAYP